jgi:large subunit ribosomal protein L4
MKAQIYTITGEKKGEASLPDSVFGVSVNPALIAQAVRVYLANQRQGNANTKTRTEVTGSTRKIFKQKGTGNARHGDIKAPTFVGGGIVHGPVTHPFTMAMPVKMRRAALRSALASRAERTLVLDGLSGVDGKTKSVIKIVKSLVGEKKNPLVVLSGDLDKALLALRNSHGVDYVQAVDLNIFDVMNHDLLMISTEALPVLESRLGRTQSEEVEVEVVEKPKTRTRKAKEESEK